MCLGFRFFWGGEWRVAGGGWRVAGSVLIVILSVVRPFPGDLMDSRHGVIARFAQRMVM